MVLSRPVGGAGAQRDFESLRETLAWSAMRRFRVLTASQRCRGKLSGERGRVMPELRRVLRAQGFEEPVSTGDCCGLFERADAALTATVSPGDDVWPYLFFEVGAPDSVTIRQVLGVLATESSLGVEVHGWEPPLP